MQHGMAVAKDANAALQAIGKVAMCNPVRHHMIGDPGYQHAHVYAAPIWAVGQALVNEDMIQTMGTFGYSPRFCYAVADKNAGAHAYFDVTSGNNLYYHATTGWDYTTGLGTPDLAGFVQAASNVLA